MSRDPADLNRLLNRSELNRTARYLEEELKRSHQALKHRRRPGAYYISYLFRNHLNHRLWGRLGAINESRSSVNNAVYCDVRVGSYRYDNITDGGLNDNSDRDESYDYVNMPVEVSKDAVKFGLWKLTDARFREAVEQYYERKSGELHFMTPYPGLSARKKQGPVRDFRYRSFPELDLDYWQYLIRKVGNLIKKYHSIQNSWFEFSAQNRQSIFVSTEGSRILNQLGIYQLSAHLWLLSRRGEGISQELNLIEGDPTDLPGEKEFIKFIKSRIDLLLSVQKAPRLNSYSGPVLLAPDAAGVFFHEVVGHRLEGSRLLSTDEGATFKDLRGKQIAPDYIDIIDDPLQTQFDKRRMIGHYRYDDEGSPAKAATLVERGVLRNFLTTAAPLPGQKTLNGHARNQRFERPISRMGNLFIINHAPVSADDMRRMFIEEIRRQKKPFGIYIKEVLGGETGTDSYDFQAFKGEIHHAVRVFPNGREEPVRGVDFVGTPLSALDAVVCMGDEPHLDNSYCGAESGMVPVSTVSPAMLMRNLELQGKDQERFTQYLLPLPY